MPWVPPPPRPPPTCRSGTDPTGPRKPPPAASQSPPGPALPPQRQARPRVWELPRAPFPLVQVQMRRGVQGTPMALRCHPVTPSSSAGPRDGRRGHGRGWLPPQQGLVAPQEGLDTLPAGPALRHAPAATTTVSRGAPIFHARRTGHTSPRCPSGLPVAAPTLRQPRVLPNYTRR